MAYQAPRVKRSGTIWDSILDGWGSIANWLTAERLSMGTFLLFVIAANVTILYLFLSDRMSLAILVAVLGLIAPLSFFWPHVGLVVFVAVTAGGFVNAIHFVTEGASGERTLSLVMAVALSARALWEWVGIPRDKRPKILSGLVFFLLLFQSFYLLHIAYIYIFDPDIRGTDIYVKEFAAGFWKPTFRYFDHLPLWLMVIPAMVILSKPERLKTVIAGFIILALWSTVITVWEYISPLPRELKIAFKLFQTGESAEGNRILSSPGYMLVFFLGMLLVAFKGLNAKLNGFWVWAVFGLVMIAFASWKGRIIWGLFAASVPFLMFMKPREAVARHLTTALAFALVVAAALFHPAVNDQATKIWVEVATRFEKTFDPRDYTGQGSFAWRVIEARYAIDTWSGGTMFQKWFGQGLQTPYGFYETVPMTRWGFGGTWQKTHIHNQYVGVLLRIGIVGLFLYLLLIGAFFYRLFVVWKVTDNRYARAFVLSLGAFMVSLFIFQAFHIMISQPEALPIIVIGWAILELIPYYKRIGFIQDEPKSVEAAAS